MKYKIEMIRRRCIEEKHGLPFEEALTKEPDWVLDENDVYYRKPIITLSIIMEAIKDIPNYRYVYDSCDGEIQSHDQYGYYETICDWKSFKNGEECTLLNQNKETINGLYELLNKDNN